MTGEEIETLRTALQPISEAQIMLVDNYPRWNETGKKHAIECAINRLRDARIILSSVFMNALKEYGES